MLLANAYKGMNVCIDGRIYLVHERSHEDKMAGTVPVSLDGVLEYKSTTTVCTVDREEPVPNMKEEDDEW